MFTERFHKEYPLRRLTMGLDMYLTAILDVSPSVQESLTTFFPEVDRIESVQSEIGYWRGADPIHSWFVKNVQQGNDDCHPHNVYQEDILALLLLVDDIISKRQSEAMLPSYLLSSEESLETLNKTKPILEKALALSKSGWRLQYRSSW